MATPLVRRWPIRTLALGLTVALVSALAPACRKPTRRGPPVPRVGMTVHARGAEPRVKLRYRFRAGETLRYRMTSRRRITGLPGAHGPVVVALSVHTAQVRSSRARQRWRVEQVVQGSPRLQGLALWVETTSRGALSSVTRRQDLPAVDPQLGQSVKQLYVAWPAEALGPGARWTQRRDVILAASTRGGFRTRMVARFVFDRVAPCGQGQCAHVSLRTTVALSHRAGRVKIKGKGTGTGRVVFDLTRGQLVTSRTRAEIGLSTSLSGDDVVQKISLDQSLEETR
jgi:hypothetical protein